MQELARNIGCFQKSRVKLQCLTEANPREMCHGSKSQDSTVLSFLGLSSIQCVQSILKPCKYSWQGEEVRGQEIWMSKKFPLIYINLQNLYKILIHNVA